ASSADVVRPWYLGRVSNDTTENFLPIFLAAIMHIVEVDEWQCVRTRASSGMSLAPYSASLLAPSSMPESIAVSWATSSFFRSATVRPSADLALSARNRTPSSRMLRIIGSVGLLAASADAVWDTSR